MTPGLSGWLWAYIPRMSGIAPVPHETQSVGTGG
jgi:hypothetical protein